MSARHSAAGDEANAGYRCENLAGEMAVLSASAEHCCGPKAEMQKKGMTAVAYIAAALAEIAGCFAFWAWLRMGKAIWWILPGMASLTLFAWLLTLVDTDQAGRACAAYGGVYIVSAILWLWVVEGARPDRWDVLGAIVCLGGAAIILFGPRSA